MRSATACARKDRGVLCRLGLKVILRLAEFKPRLLGKNGTDLAGKLRIGVDPRTDGRSADRQFQQPFQPQLHPKDPVRDLGGIAGKFLAQSYRGGVLQMGAPDLDDVGKFLGLGA